ncbi:MAG: DUF4369 domain-containing protein [Bacteroidaceae bacterium]|nr:DUF4369 domain-containing protein [Bacteroidaceae bacterium]
MKRGISAILTLFLLLAASCGRKDIFILRGTVPGDTDSILITGFDSRFDRIDTIFCKDGKFEWRFRPDTVTTLLFVLPDGHRYPVFAQKGVKSMMVIPDEPDRISVSGGQYNDSYLSFSLASVNDTVMEQTYARIDSFITRDPFSEVTPFLIYEYMIQRYHADESVTSKLISRMSGNMQEAPYMIRLNAEFKGGLQNDVYLESWTVSDSLNGKITLSQMNNSSNSSYLLVCIWATWAGNEAYRARLAMDSIRIKYEGRNLNLADVSIDVDAKKWKEAISKDTLDWFSYNDNQGWECLVAKSCNLNELPVYILISSGKRTQYITRSLADMDRELNRRLPKKEEPKKDSKKKK